MKILVTGSSGFVGSHLILKLEKIGTVHCLKNDLTNFNAVEQEVLQISPDIIVHLAAKTEVEKSFYEQIDFSQVNYVGSINLIEAANKVSNLKNFIFASTMEVYGWQPISDEVRDHSFPKIPIAFNENTVPNPNAPYSVAKYGVETYLKYMHRTQDFPFSILRQTNSYGRKDNNFFVTEQIIHQMLTKPEQIHLGYKEPYRNFIFVDDLIDAWMSVIENTDKVNDGKIFTIGPDNPIKIEHYANLIADKIDWKGNINWNTRPARPGEIFWLNSDYEFIKSVTGWYPKISLSEGLDKTIDIWKEKCLGL
jgi:nucleoside-diphosphate-sugar epimerase